uniref:CBF domain-containing protein n=1 Tax=Heligmosomoides polygyrus TaxID=6339 RepID=A0A183FPV5_HELPZ
LLSLEEEADALLKTQGGSEASWLLSVIKKGTASDRMTAMQLQMHTSPVHSLAYMEIMIGALERKNTREALEILPILEEIFLDHFLPVNRKLVPFNGRPLKRIGEICSNSENGRKRLLILWRFEHRLKLVYERFLRAVEVCGKRALRTALHLLAERPEGERFLLSLLVNKMGHPKTQIGAFVATLLEDLTKRQPKMRPVIVTEVERLIYRSNVSPKAHLYASTFLSQVSLSVLPHFFFQFAVSCRIIPFRSPKVRWLISVVGDDILPEVVCVVCLEKAESLTEDIDTLYKIVHTSSYSVSLQTLKLLFQVHQISDSLSDRFYTALYRKLLTDVPHSCYNQLLLLMFKALKADPSDNRVRSFVKRLLQAATCSPPSLTAGILILISRVLETKKSVIVLQKHVDRVAIVDAKLGITDDDEERYFDVGIDGKPIVLTKKEEDEGAEDEKKTEDPTGVNYINKPGWVHRKQTGSHAASSPYNHAVRNPLFVDCRNLVDTELLLLSRHYHPSVAIFAKALIQDGCINYKGDPLEDFTLMKFLDRFAFKNPKEERKSTGERVLRKKMFDPWGVKKLPVSSKEYVNKKLSELPADEHYLHRFASMKFSGSADNKEKKEEDDWEIESVDSAEFDAILDKFEPGAANDEFDVDYSKEFTAEKRKPKDGEDDEVNFEMSDDDDDEDEEVNADEDEVRTPLLLCFYFRYFSIVRRRKKRIWRKMRR